MTLLLLCRRQELESAALLKTVAKAEGGGASTFKTLTTLRKLYAPAAHCRELRLQPCVSRLQPRVSRLQPRVSRLQPRVSRCAHPQLIADDPQHRAALGSLGVLPDCNPLL